MALEIERLETTRTLEDCVAKSSSDDDEPVQIKRNLLKKKIALSDDDSDNVSDKNSSPKLSNPVKNLSSDEEDIGEQNQDGGTKRKKKSRIRRAFDSDESDNAPISIHNSPVTSKNIGDDNSENKSPNKNKKKKKNKFEMKIDSDGSDMDDRPLSRAESTDEEEKLNRTALQRRILENLRSENGYDGDSSGDEGPNNQSSNRSSHSNEDDKFEDYWDSGASTKSKKPKAPQRKSAAACRKAMQEERLKITSESQRMVRESKASLPYHKPKQRSLLEFLKARPKPSPQLKGTKYQQVAIEVIGQELEAQEKLVEEFYKAESDEERLTPPPPSEPQEYSTILDDNRILKVLLTTPEEQIDLDVKDKETSTPASNSSEIVEKAELENSTETIKLLESGRNEIAKSCHETANTANEHSLCDNSLEKDPVKISNEKISVPEDMEIDNTTLEHVKENDNLLTTEHSDGKKSETIAANDSSNKILTNILLSNELTDACLTPGDANNEILFLKPADKVDCKKSHTYNSANTEDSSDVTDFQLVYEDSNDFIPKENDDKIKNPAVEMKLNLENNSDDFHLFYDDSDDVIPKDNKINNEESTRSTNDKSSSDLDTNTDNFHLVYDDTDDFIPKDENKGNDKEMSKVKDKKSAFDLEKLYNSEHLLKLDNEEQVKPKELKGKAKILSQLKLKSGPVRLKGGPNEVIDLDDKPKLPSGVNDLVQRFMRQTRAGAKKSPVATGILKLMQEGEKVEDIPELKSNPGAKIGLLKSELKQSLLKLRNEEFKKRQREYQLYENETEGLLGEDGDGKSLSDDELMYVDDTPEIEEGSTESEPELEDDVVIKDKPVPRSEFMDDEAEEEIDDEEVGEEDLDAEEEGEVEAAIEGTDEDESEEEEESEQEEESETENLPGEEDINAKTPEGKRKFSRIKRFDDSDDENITTDDLEEAKCNSHPTTEALDNIDEFDAKDESFHSDYNKSFNLSILDEMGTENSNDISNNRNLPNSDTIDARFPSGLTQLIKESRVAEPVDSEENILEQTVLIKTSENELLDSKAVNMIENTKQLPPDAILNKNGAKPIALKELIGETQTQTQDLADLCSGKFSTLVNTVPNEINKLVEGTDSLTDNLADLCSGKFTTLANTQPKEINKLLGNTDSLPDNLADLCSGQFTTQVDEISKPQGLEKIITNATLPINLEDICSGKFVTQNNSQEHITEINEALQTDGDDKSKISMVEMRIVSDDEDEETVNNGKAKKGKRKLAFSDDEDDGIEDVNSDPEDNIEEMESDIDESQALEEEDGYVDYDSEENEVVTTSKPQEFFEAEAELSGDEEWGSADEDEADLDALEEELGDKEKIDDEELASQLGKIHARRMLDDDKRDVRLFQEAFLEDGDLHSENGGRQRQFRWKNNDDTFADDDGSWTGGARPDLSGDEGGDDDDCEVESSWRTARLERETWLLNNKDKVVLAVEEADENSELLQLGRTLVAKMGASKLKLTTAQLSSDKKPPPKSPGKAILQALKRKSGSFLGRRSISMTHVVALAGTEGESGTMVSTSSRNFVFSTISPSSIKMQGDSIPEVPPDEDAPNIAPTKKRVRIASKPDLLPAAKKKKVASSVFQLLN